VTVPHKQAILPYLDLLTPAARKIGAVNAVYRQGRRIVGDNTDGDGYLMALKNQARFSICNKHCVVIGAGGAALAIVQALVKERPASLTILNRSARPASRLGAVLSQQNKRLHVGWTKLSAKVVDNQLARQSLQDADLVVNTTTLGMTESHWPDLDWVRTLKKSCLVSDIVYNPRQTTLLLTAQKCGLKILEGYGMLLYQGALAFEKFTGRPAPVKVMEKALLKALKNS
jgi:shikimate dehydrogenase